MNVQIDTNSYNFRRYSRPWIAKVNFAANPKGDFDFGHFVGGDGAAGFVMINAQPGDIVAYGQKDYRQPRNSTPSYYQVADDGSLIDLDGKAAAYKAFAAAKQAV